jgi:peptidase S41-like protein
MDPATSTSTTARSFRRVAKFAQVAFVATLFATIACHDGATGMTSVVAATTPRVANLRAFARLYGVVRWFHPSDAASAIDWDRFAVEGSHRIVDAPDARALRAGLTELFAPIAPTVHIVGTSEEFPNEPALHPRSVTGLDVIAWQHRGYGDSTIAAGGYASKRRHRGRTVTVPGEPFAALSQSVDAAPYRGARIRLRGKLRTANHAQARLWLRVDRGDVREFFDNMGAHPVVSEAWASAEIIGVVDTDATAIVLGALMSGVGTTWYDDLELSAQVNDGTWKAIEIQDGDFEAPDLLKSWRPGIGKRTQSQSIDGWSVTLDHNRPASGTTSLRIEAATKVVTEELFDDAPEPGETVDIDLGSGLRARVPIALYSKDNHTIGDDPEVARRTQAAPPPTSTAGFDAVAGAADVIVVWNVLEHFWPYWNVVSVDWNTELDSALADALDDHSVDDHVMTLERLSAAAPDDHASTSCLGETARALPPFAVDLVEHQVVVTASADKAIERGDVIVSVDGRPAAQALAAEEALISGSPQWRVVRGLARFARGPIGSALTLRVHRGTTDLDITVGRTDRDVPDEFSHRPIERFNDGVYYVDLDRAPMVDIDAVMDRLATAPGVIFDLRDYPNSNHQVLSHLLTRPDDANAWLAIPHVIRPDRPSAPVAWTTEGWSLPVLQPHISGRVAFLTGPGAASQAESVMGLVEHYHLGQIVGAATAGTNGDIAQISEPTGCSTIFTGRRVTKLDGSRHHLIGVQPTIPVSRTIAGVAAGRDEVLEKALAYVRATK